MPRTEAQSRALFDAWAESYDDDLQAADGPLAGYQTSLQTFTAALPVMAETRLLDIGIGSGAVAAQLVARAAGVQITGIDPSLRMLDLCREKHPDFILHSGTFTAIPAPDTAFDGAASGFAFHETPPPQRAAACAELARVLKPGGWLGLLDIMFASPLATRQARDLIPDQWDDEEDYALVGALDTMLRQAGFVGLSWQQTGPFHWCVLARRLS